MQALEVSDCLAWTEARAASACYLHRGLTLHGPAATLARDVWRYGSRGSEVPGVLSGRSLGRRSNVIKRYCYGVARCNVARLWVFHILGGINVFRSIYVTFRNRLSGVQLIEQRLGLFQIKRIEALSEPAIDRSEKIAGPVAFTLIAE
jgi:hypothetical protein